MVRPEVDGDADELERRTAEYCAAAQNSALPADSENAEVLRFAQNDTAYEVLRRLLSPSLPTFHQPSEPASGQCKG